MHDNPFKPDCFSFDVGRSMFDAHLLPVRCSSFNLTHHEKNPRLLRKPPGPFQACGKPQRSRSGLPVHQPQQTAVVRPGIAAQPRLLPLAGLPEPGRLPRRSQRNAPGRRHPPTSDKTEPRFIPVMPTNLYGPNDNFDLENSHVLPALMRKFRSFFLHNAFPPTFLPIDESKKSQLTANRVLEVPQE